MLHFVRSVRRVTWSRGNRVVILGSILLSGCGAPHSRPAAVAPAVHRLAVEAPRRALPEVDCREQKCIALTLDDGPGPYTAKALRILAEHHVKATFFLVGEMVEEFPQLVR